MRRLFFNISVKSVNNGTMIADIEDLGMNILSLLILS